jgi:hypothetical protein
MNTNHALQIALRSIILIALTAGAAACGAAPEGPTTADEKSLTEPTGDASDPDAAAPSSQPTPAPSPSLPASYGPAPHPEGPGGPPSGGYIPTHAPGMPHAQ